VNVPPGEYTVGTIQLKDNVTLYIEAGATLFLSQEKEDYFGPSPTMIYADNAKNIAVTGRGTLDGLAQYEYLEMRAIDPEIVKEMENARAAGWTCESIAARKLQEMLTCSCLTTVMTSC
jgi:polygalacturonase